MGKRYELRFDGKVIESESLHALKRIAKGTECYYEIYVYYCPKTKFTEGNQKINILDMREILKLHQQQKTILTISQKFGVTRKTILNILRQMKTEKV